MKRPLALAFSILLLLSFSGCRESGLHTTGAATETTETTAAAPTREAKTRLEFFLEGMSEYQDATLYVGDGYSLYITDDGWLEIPGQNGEMIWRSSYNPDISLRVIPNAGASLTQAKEALFRDFPIIDEDGQYVFGSDDSGLFYRAARLIETPSGILAAVWTYSLEAAEGFGVRLRVLADTLMACD